MKDANSTRRNKPTHIAEGLIPFEAKSARKEVCHCGAEYVSQALDLDWLEQKTEKFRNMWLSVYPQARVPAECIPCSRKTNDLEARRSDWTLAAPVEPFRRSA